MYQALTKIDKFFIICTLLYYSALWGKWIYISVYLSDTLLTRKSKTNITASQTDHK